MQRITFLLVGFFTFCTAHAQTHYKHYVIAKQANSENLQFNYTAQTGHCTIAPAVMDDLAAVYYRSDTESHSALLHLKENKNYQEAHLAIEHEKTDGLLNTLTSSLISTNEHEDEHKCDLYFSKQIPLGLDLKYGSGTSEADLSGLSVNKLKIYSGKADVKVLFNRQIANPIVMDSLLIDVKKGSVAISSAQLMRAQQVKAKVGFGDLELEYKQSPTEASTIDLMVGAGSATISLKSEAIPTRITILPSPLCKIKIPKSFTLMQKNVYVNDAYLLTEAALLDFNIDVGMGKVIFTE